MSRYRPLYGVFFPGSRPLSPFPPEPRRPSPRSGIEEGGASPVETVTSFLLVGVASLQKFFAPGFFQKRGGVGFGRRAHMMTGGVAIVCAEPGSRRLRLNQEIPARPWMAAIR